MTNQEIAEYASTKIRDKKAYFKYDKLKDKYDLISKNKGFDIAIISKDWVYFPHEVSLALGKDVIFAISALLEMLETGDETDMRIAMNIEECVKLAKKGLI